jgi:signal recognition particle subunit SRP72
MAQEIKVYELFKSLDDEIKKENWPKVIEICDKILERDPKDKDAISCKCIALLQVGRFEDVLQFLAKNKEFDRDLHFEKCYALYRTRQYQQALGLLRASKDRTLRMRLLEAQILFRLEDYANCAQIYENLINQGTEVTPELLTNFIAALTGSGNTKKCVEVLSKYKKILKESFEFAYNGAVNYLEMGDLDTAQHFLNDAKLVLEEQKKRGEISETEFQDEVAIIVTQLAYINQRRGKEREALEVYENILKSNPSDISVRAVATNNSLAVRKGDRLNSTIRLAQLTSPEFQEKLTSKQKRILGMNRCLLLLQMTKMDECKAAAIQLQKEYPESEILPIITASIFYSERKVDKAIQTLKDYINQNPQKSTNAKLCLAQIYLTQENTKEVTEILKSVAAEFRAIPNMLSSLVTLYEKVNDIDNAIKVLDEGLLNVSRNNEHYSKILRKNADFKMKFKRYKEAAEMYKQLLEFSQSDLQALTSLIIAYSYFDPETAEKYEARLPPLRIDETKFDINKLENVPFIITTTSKREPRASSSANSGTQPTKKKKRKRHNKKPKNYDPKVPPDPERWLPRWQRSSFKGRKRGKKQQPAPKPTQGAPHLTLSKEEEEKILQERKEKATNEKAPPTTKASALSKIKPGPNKRNRRRKNK